MGLLSFRRLAGVDLNKVIAPVLAHRSQSTRLQYKQAIESFSAFLAPRDPGSATSDDALRFLERYLERNGHRSRFEPGAKQTLAPVTVKKIACILSCCYTRAVAINLVKVNPFLEALEHFRKACPGEKRPTLALSSDEVQKILKSILSNDKIGIRDRAFFAILFGGALRISEVLQLNCYDVQRTTEGRTLLILRKTKSKKLQEQLLPLWASDLVCQFLEQRRKEGADLSAPLICNYRDTWTTPDNSQRVGYSTARRWFDKRLKLAGISNAAITPHAARATAITRLLSKGVPTKAVQQFSRHSSPAMVDIYDKRRFVGDDHPSEKLTYS